VAAADRHHWDASGGGYYQAADDAADVIVRLKPVHDNAVPAANGTMVQVLARLFHLTGEDRYRARAEATLEAFSGQVAAEFANMPSLLAGFELLAEPVQVVIVGEAGAEDTGTLLRAVAEAPLPTRVLMRIAPGETLPPGHPAHGKTGLDGRAGAYVCRGGVCTTPIADPRLLRSQLGAR
jgi:Highly conserved protein containing a thioredoxin domain